MSGRVTRKNNRRRNRGAMVLHEYLICSNRMPGECVVLTHEKEYGRLIAEFDLLGPWEGVRELPVCGCLFIALPVCAL